MSHHFSRHSDLLLMSPFARNTSSCKAVSNATVVVGNKGAAANTKLPCLNFLIQRPITKICEDPGCVGKCADITAAPGQCVHFKYPLNHDISELQCRNPLPA